MCILHLYCDLRYQNVTKVFNNVLNAILFSHSLLLYEQRHRLNDSVIFNHLFRQTFVLCYVQGNQTYIFENRSVSNENYKDIVIHVIWIFNKLVEGMWFLFLV